MLKIENLSVNYGYITALAGINLEVNKGEIVTLIGGNGAGKTTTLMSISGLVQKASGKITFKGEDITKTAPDKIVKMGVCHVPEGRKIFPVLTVYENLIAGTLGNPTLKKSQISDLVEKNYELFPRLKERSKQNGGSLSGGEQQMLAMGRALMSHPKIILMDEPSMGLSPLFVSEIFDIIKEISDNGTTVLLVEQNAKKALSIADRAYVLETGKIVLEGDAEEMMNNDSVKKAYLGE
mgnify:CR=1 FL=1